MLGKKAKSRIFFLILFFLFIFIVIFLILKSLEENIVYFLTPTEINKKHDIILSEKIRVGGLVKDNSIKKDDKFLIFTITDFENEIIVTYEGLVPNLFSEGKGVVAEGKLKDKKYFIADKILAKHDENYMPPEVKKVLDKINSY